MIKLVDILEEGAILLSQLERNQVEEMLPKIIDAIKGPIVPENKLKLVGTIKYEFADKTLGEVKVYIGYDDSSSLNAYFNSLDKNDPKDNIIVIQQNKFLPYFGKIGNTILKVNKFLVGDENAGIELLRKTLKHELIHAKDPALNHHYFKEPYDLNNPKTYYKSWAEFQTMTGQFFESIITGVDRILRSTKWPSEPLDKKINQIETALSEILNFFAGTSTFISQSTYDFIQNTKSRNILQQIFKFIDDIVGVSVGGNAFKTYNQYLRAIKRYHPEAYNEFLKDLYKIIDKSKNSVNMFLEKTREERKEMYRRSGAEIGLGSIPEPETVPPNIRLVKSQSMNSSSMFKSTNEIKRIQQLAGIQEGYYTTPTDDPKTAQLHLTTDKKPSLAKSYEPLSPKSKRTSQLTPEKVEDALITALRNSKMNYDKAIDTVSRKYSLDKNKLRKDFPKNDILYKAAPLEEIVNKVLEKIRINEAESKNLVTDPRILALAAKIVKQPVDKVEDKVDAVLAGKEEKNKENVNESLAITLALALPMILEAGGSIAGWANKKFGLSKEELEEYKKWQAEYAEIKKNIEFYSKKNDPKSQRYVDNKKAELAKMKEEGNKKFEGKIAKFMEKAGHGLHSLYTSPIRALLWTISLFTPKGSDLKDPKIREKIANIIYATGMIGFAGIGMYQSLTHLAGVSEAATAILDGTKTGKSASEIIQDVPIVIKAFAT